MALLKIDSPDSMRILILMGRKKYHAVVKLVCLTAFDIDISQVGCKRSVLRYRHIYFGFWIELLIYVGTEVGSRFR